MYLVTGAAGHFGQAVINHLLTTYKVSADKIIAATRDISKLDNLKSKGVHVRSANFDHQESLVKAFEGATRLLLISTDAIEAGKREVQHLKAVSAAEMAGVSHLVYTSLHKADTSAVSFASDHVHTEKFIADGKFKGHSILRNNWYFENVFFALPQALKSGTQYSAAGQGKIAHIARDDLARAAAAALASGKNEKATYELSGGEEYTTEQIAALVSKATGKPLAVVHVPVEGLVQGMLGAGLPEGMARTFASFDEAIAKGAMSGTSADFKKMTGAEPMKFEDWLKKNAAALVA